MIVICLRLIYLIIAFFIHSSLYAYNTHPQTYVYTHTHQQQKKHTHNKTNITHAGKFINDLKAPLGFKGEPKKVTGIEMKTLIRRLELPCTVDSAIHRVHYMDVCLSLSLQVTQRAFPYVYYCYLLLLFIMLFLVLLLCVNSLNNNRIIASSIALSSISYLYTYILTTCTHLPHAHTHTHSNDDMDAIPLDNEMLKCIKYQANRVHPELKKLRLL